MLVALKEDLFPGIGQCLRTKLSWMDSKNREERIDNKHETVKVLTTIRNKHSFHVAHDPFYPWKYITEGPATADKLIGVGRTTQGTGWVFTWDTDLILAFIRDHALQQTDDILEDYVRVKKIIDEASVELYKLFLAIVDEMLRNRIYAKGDKEEATRDYRKDS